MFLLENINLAISGLRANKMRALLTMLGIIIGISSVIGIVTIGNALTNNVTSSIQALGATNIYASVKSKAQTGVRQTRQADFSAGDLITNQMITNYRSIYGDYIDAISYSSSLGSAQVKDGKLYANITANAVNDEYFKGNNIELLSGRSINSTDMLGKRKTAVVSDLLVNNMYAQGKNPIGEQISVSLSNQLQTFTIIGIYKYSPSAFGGRPASSAKDTTTDFYIPITTGQLISSSKTGYSFLTITAKTGLDIDSFSNTTQNFFNKYYAKNPKFDIGMQTIEKQLETVTSILGGVQLAVSVIAAISLLVGGIGVMNIMLVSVTERTREIGTRKALGAKSSHIKIQFIVEAMIICVIGGIIGVALGLGIGEIGATIMKQHVQPSISIILVSVLFSMIIGVFFGYYPASKAAKLDPIEALRYE